jgi:hypothetical protein
MVDFVKLIVIVPQTSIIYTTDLPISLIGLMNPARNPNLLLTYLQHVPAAANQKLETHTSKNKIRISIPTSSSWRNRSVDERSRRRMQIRSRSTRGKLRVIFILQVTLLLGLRAAAAAPASSCWFHRQEERPDLELNMEESICKILLPKLVLVLPRTTRFLLMMTMNFRRRNQLLICRRQN